MDLPLKLARFFFLLKLYFQFLTLSQSNWISKNDIRATRVRIGSSFSKNVPNMGTWVRLKTASTHPDLQYDKFQFIIVYKNNHFPRMIILQKILQTHPKAHFEIFSAPNFHFFIISPEVIEICAIHGKESASHSGRSNRLRSIWKSNQIESKPKLH